MMRKLRLKEMQDQELQIMIDIDTLANQLNIPYYLGFGTLIGAVRHKGFIPWDDDIDIIIPRRYYSIFLVEFEKKNKKYKVFSMYNNDNYMNPWAKIVDPSTRLIERNEKNVPGMGLFVDIFPLDNVPSNPFGRKIFYSKARFFKWIRYYSYKSDREFQKSSFIEKIKIIIGRMFKTRWALKKIDQLCSSMVNNDTGMVGIPVIRRENEIYSSRVLGSGKLTEFEGQNFMIPDDYDKFLKVAYGNYMKLPPKEERVSRHDFDIYANYF